MEQRDYLLRQLELMTQAMVALIRRLLGMKDPGHEEEAMQATDELLKEYLGTTLQEIIDVPAEKCIEFLVHEKKLHPSNVDLFAEMLVLNATLLSDLEQKKKLLKIALELLTWLDVNGKLYSMDRQQKIVEVRRLLGIKN